MTHEAKMAQRELSQVRHLAARYRHMTERALRLQETAQIASSSFGARNCSGTESRSKIEQNMVAKIDLEWSMYQELGMIWLRQQETLEKIRQLHDEREKDMLELRYVDCLDWYSVMDRMHISSTQSFRIHESALTHYWKLFGDEKLGVFGS